MSNKNICTPFELKRFAHGGQNPTVFNFAKWIESKTNRKYTVIELEFIADSLKALNEQASFAINLNDKFKAKWKEVIGRL